MSFLYHYIILWDDEIREIGKGHGGPGPGGRLAAGCAGGGVFASAQGAGKKVLKFDGAFDPEGCGIALTGDEYKVSVTDLTFYVIWHDKQSAD